MFFNLANPVEIKAAQSRLDFLVAKQKRINLTEKRKKRTYKQNRYLYLLIGGFSLETGYTLAESKMLYKLQSTEVYCYTKREQKFIRSSADLDTKQMSISIERFRIWANEVAEVYLPSANEMELLEHIENNLEKYDNKIYI